MTSTLSMTTSINMVFWTGFTTLIIFIQRSQRVSGIVSTQTTILFAIIWWITIVLFWITMFTISTIFAFATVAFSVLKTNLFKNNLKTPYIFRQMNGCMTALASFSAFSVHVNIVVVDDLLWQLWWVIRILVFFLSIIIFVLFFIFDILLLTTCSSTCSWFCVRARCCGSWSRCSC